jgi:hypothetical protein
MRLFDVSGGVVPKDSSTTVLIQLKVSTTLYGVMSFLALIGILQGVAYLAVNTKYRSTR